MVGPPCLVALFYTRVYQCAARVNYWASGRSTRSERRRLSGALLDSTLRKDTQAAVSEPPAYYLAFGKYFPLHGKYRFTSWCLKTINLREAVRCVFQPTMLPWVGTVLTVAPLWEWAAAAP